MLICSVVGQEYIINNLSSLIISLDIFTGVTDLKAVDQYTSLAELGMNSMMIVEIKQILERQYDMFFTAKDIRNLNFAKLTEMHNEDLEREKAETQQTDEENAEVSGIQLLIQILGNEGMSTDISMELQTRMDPRKIKVFLLPGIQGHGQIFNSLASNIRSTATALQYGIINTELNNMTIPEYADYLLPVCIRGRA